MNEPTAATGREEGGRPDAVAVGDSQHGEHGPRPGGVAATDPRLLTLSQLDDIAEDAALVQPDKTRFTAATVTALLGHIHALQTSPRTSGWPRTSASERSRALRPDHDVNVATDLWLPEQHDQRCPARNGGECAHEDGCKTASAAYPLFGAGEGSRPSLPVAQDGPE